MAIVSKKVVIEALETANLCLQCFAVVKFGDLVDDCLFCSICDDFVLTFPVERERITYLESSDDAEQGGTYIRIQGEFDSEGLERSHIDGISGGLNNPAQHGVWKNLKAIEWKGDSQGQAGVV